MGKLSGFLAKLKAIRHIEIIACCAVLAAVLVAYFSFASCGGETVDDVNGKFDIDKSDYCASMQAQVENIVSQNFGRGQRVSSNQTGTGVCPHHFPARSPKTPKPWACL